MPSEEIRIGLISKHEVYVSLFKISNILNLNFNGINAIKSITKMVVDSSSYESFKFFAIKHD